MLRRFGSIASFLFVIAMLLLLASPVFADTYNAYIPITIYNNSTTVYGQIPVVVSMNNTQLYSLGYINSTGLNTDLVEGTSSIYYMVDSSKLPLLTSGFASKQSRTYYYRLGNSPGMASMPVMVGNEGYYTVPYTIGLKLLTPFEVNQSGYIDSTNGTSKDLVFKQFALTTSINNTGTIQSTFNGNITGSLSISFRSSIDNASIGTMQACAYISANATTSVAGALQALSTTATNFTTSWATNPWTGKEWTVENVNSYYFGVRHVCIPGAGEGRTVFTTWLNVTVGGQTLRPIGVGNKNLITAVTPTGAPHWSVLDEVAINQTDRVSTYAANPGTADEIDTYRFGPYTGATVGGPISSGVHTITTRLSGGTFSLLVDSVVLDSKLVGSMGPQINSNTYYFMKNNSIQYLNSMNMSILGVEKVKHELIQSTSSGSIPDRSGNGNTGTITWGSNPTPLEISFGALTTSGTFTMGDPTITVPDIFVNMTDIGFYENLTATGSLLPQFELFEAAGIALGWTTPTTYSIIAFLIPAIAMAFAVAVATGSIFIGVAFGTVMLGMAAGTGLLAAWIPVSIVAIGIFVFILVKRM